MLKEKRLAPALLASVAGLGLLTACGAVYTPQNMPQRFDENSANQQAIDVSFVTMDSVAVRKANRDPYPRRVIDGSNLNAPGRLQTEAAALHSQWPPKVKPKPYLIGAGDTLTLTRVVNSGRASSLVNQTLKVSETGYITLLDLGREGLQEKLPENGPPPVYKIGVGDILTYATILTVVDAKGLVAEKIQTQTLRVSAGGRVNILGVGEVPIAGLDLETAQREVSQTQIRKGIANDFQLAITGFRSKRYVVGGEYVRNGIFPYSNEPATLNDLLTTGITGAGVGTATISASDADILNVAVHLMRDGQEYRFAAKRLLTGTKLYYIHAGDRIIVETANLAPGPEPIRVSGMTTDQARKAIERALSANSQTPRTDLSVTSFASQKVYVSGDVATPGVYPFTDLPVLLAEALAEAGMVLVADADAVGNFTDKDKLIRLYRGGKSYRFSARKLIENPAGHYLQSGDRMVVEDLRYRSEKVIIAGAVPEQKVYAITAEDRPTLSDALYATNALGFSFESTAGDPSQIYVIRQTDKVYAYHIDGSNPARLLLAGDFELRPNDIVFVAEQPINQFNRVLQALLTGIASVRAVIGG
jgi:protein involved in polysaccharide export with SLBB domain